MSSLQLPVSFHSPEHWRQPPGLSQQSPILCCLLDMPGMNSSTVLASRLPTKLRLRCLQSHPESLLHAEWVGCSPVLHSVEGLLVGDVVH